MKRVLVLAAAVILATAAPAAAHCNDGVSGGSGSEIIDSIGLIVLIEHGGNPVTNVVDSVVEVVGCVTGDAGCL